MLPPLPLLLDQSLRRELQLGERVQWAAQPSGQHMLSGFGIWAFAIPWTVFALAWEAMSILPWFASSKTPSWAQMSFGIVFPLFGLPFILIGFWMLWQPIRTIRNAKQTVYALTNLRVLRLVDGQKREMQSVMLDQIGPIERSEKRDGWGHLRIQTHSRLDSDGHRITERFEMIGVPDVAALERLILSNRASQQRQ